MNKENFTEIKPQIVSLKYGSEPDLHTMIRYYYVSHCGRDCGKEFTDKYINEWLNIYNGRNKE